ncbi:Putative AC transposase [Linum perenne]
MLMMDDEPFKYVERAGFKHFMSRACPMFVFPCRKTVKTDCVKLFLEMKESLKTFFKSKGMGRVSITTDCWTSLRNINYIAITAHFISRNWQLHKRIICFRKITSHKGEDIANSVMMCLDEWDLKTVLCCTVDNASANDVVVRHMRERFALWGTNILDGKFLHMRCVAHIINLVVSDGLEEIGMSVRRIREAVKWITASSSREEVWKRCTNSMVIECKKALTLDVPTRWNSTYLMLESVEPYASAFRPYEGMLPAFKADLDTIGTPTDEDWVNVRWMMEYLKKFYDLTCLVSGTSYVTSHLFFKEMCDLFDLISEVEQSEDPKISSMARKMRMKVAKYWAEDEVANPRMNRIIYLAAALDPRQKLKHVQKCLSKVYGSRRAIEIVGEVKDLFAELFESYKTMLLPPRAPRTSVSQSSATSSQNNRRPSVNTDIRRLSTRGRCSAIHDSDDEEDMVDSSELTLYFTEAQYREKDQEDNSVVDSFDILKWWATHGVRFPVLAEIARDMLAIPISTVASESAFSTGGRVLNSFRTSLIPGIVEALICCGDWLRMSSIHSVSMNDEEDVPVEDLETEYEEGKIFPSKCILCNIYLNLTSSLIICVLCCSVENFCKFELRHWRRTCT